MKPYDQNITTFEATFTGYVDALNRFEDAAKTRFGSLAWIENY